MLTDCRGQHNNNNNNNNSSSSSSSSSSSGNNNNSNNNNSNNNNSNSNNNNNNIKAATESTMGNAPLAALTEYFVPSNGKLGVSTMTPNTQKAYDWSAALDRALHMDGEKKELSKRQMDRLHTFLRKAPPQTDVEEWEARWMEKFEKRWPDLTPADVPYYMGQRLRYKYDIFLDEKTFGASDYEWGNSDCPTLIEYAMREDLPCVGLLLRFWDDKDDEFDLGTRPQCSV